MTGLELLTRCREGAQELDRLGGQLERMQGCGVSPDEPRMRELTLHMALRRETLDMERMAACRLCDLLPEPECTVMYRYFVLGQSQGEIVTAMHYSVSYYKKKKKSGVEIVGLIGADRVDSLLPEGMKKQPLG